MSLRGAFWRRGNLCVIARSFVATWQSLSYDGNVVLENMWDTPYGAFVCFVMERRLFPLAPFLECFRNRGNKRGDSCRRTWVCRTRIGLPRRRKAPRNDMYFSFPLAMTKYPYHPLQKGDTGGTLNACFFDFWVIYQCNWECLNFEVMLKWFL